MAATALEEQIPEQPLREVYQAPHTGQAEAEIMPDTTLWMPLLMIVRSLTEKYLCSGRNICSLVHRAAVKEVNLPSQTQHMILEICHQNQNHQMFL